MLRSKPDESTDITARLHQVEQLSARVLVAPREPLDDAPARLDMSWVRDVVPCGGQMYVLGGKDGPRFQSITLLQAARRPAA